MRKEGVGRALLAFSSRYRRSGIRPRVHGTLLSAQHLSRTSAVRGVGHGERAQAASRSKKISHKNAENPRTPYFRAKLPLCACSTSLRCMQTLVLILWQKGMYDDDI